MQTIIKVIYILSIDLLQHLKERNFDKSNERVSYMCMYVYMNVCIVYVIYI